jgi:hypothetical protein
VLLALNVAQIAPGRMASGILVVESSVQCSVGSAASVVFASLNRLAPFRLLIDRF